MRGHIRKRGQESYQICIHLGPGPDGKSKYHYETVKGRKKDAEARMTVLLRELDQGGLVRPEKMTLGQFLDRWLEDYVRPNLSYNTHRSYADFVAKHVTPNLGKIPIQKLTPMHLQNYYTAEMANGRLGGGQLAPSSVRRQHNMIHRALGHAVQWGLVQRNVADAVEPPRLRASEPKTWTQAQLAKFLATAQQHRQYPFFLTAAHTGMRLGELLGLQWSDVDLQKREIRVRRTLIVPGRDPAFGPPKTTKGNRTIPIAGDVVSALKTQRAEQLKERLFMGQGYFNLDLVFSSNTGASLNKPNVAQKVWRALIKKAGLPYIRFHDLRHTHATLLLEAGAHPKVVSERLGHSNINITLDVYSHVMPGMQERVSETFANLLRTTASQDKG